MSGLSAVGSRRRQTLFQRCAAAATRVVKACRPKTIALLESVARLTGDRAFDIGRRGLPVLSMRVRLVRNPKVFPLPAASQRITGTVLGDAFEPLKTTLGSVAGIAGLSVACSGDHGVIRSSPTNRSTAMRASLLDPSPRLTADGTDARAKALAKPPGRSGPGVGGEQTPLGADRTVDIALRTRFCVLEMEILVRSTKASCCWRPNNTGKVKNHRSRPARTRRARPGNQRGLIPGEDIRPWHGRAAEGRLDPVTRHPCSELTGATVALRSAIRTGCRQSPVTGQTALRTRAGDLICSLECPAAVSKRVQPGNSARGIHAACRRSGRTPLTRSSRDPCLSGRQRI